MQVSTGTVVDGKIEAGEFIELAYLFSSQAALAALAENYVGLPF